MMMNSSPHESTNEPSDSSRLSVGKFHESHDLSYFQWQPIQATPTNSIKSSLDFDEILLKGAIIIPKS